MAERRRVSIHEASSKQSNPEKCELNALNWYETEMLRIEGDILTIINNHQHPIFRYQWNAQNWIEQMKKSKRKDQDRIRHLLRVTVMLNTIAILRKKKYWIDGERILLQLTKIQTIIYNHNSKLFQGKILLQSEYQTPYPSTTVRVINEDCLVLYQYLVGTGSRPLLLNMVNPINPGGGYRKGDWGQEADIFRRSDLSQSLDWEMTEKDRLDRFYWTSEGQLKNFDHFNPIDEFGGLYTSGITVFRQTEEHGYSYMKNPLSNVHCLSMSAYHQPSLNKKNQFKNRLAMNTHRKIGNIFAIGYQQKHDCLILSAFGCGFLKNPPEHIALLFKSVIYQYAGYFEKIYFAIIDNHLNENFFIFKKLLDGFVIEPRKSLDVNQVSGPYRIVKKTLNGELTLADTYISYIPPCRYGALCYDRNNEDHNNQYSHPPKCPLQSLTSICNQIDDQVHLSTFVHIKKCRDGGQCRNEDQIHLIDSDHPEYCQKKSLCNDLHSQHLFDYKHLPICQYGLDCFQYLQNDHDHLKSFRHFKSISSDNHSDVFTPKPPRRESIIGRDSPLNIVLNQLFQETDTRRFSDIDIEPQRMLLPIKGFENISIDSLEEAVVPLLSFLPNVKKMISIAKFKCIDPKDGLTSDQSASIMLYTMEWKPHEQSFYFQLNSVLREVDREKLNPWFPYLRLVIDALQKLPSIEHTVYRGVKLDLTNQYRRGETIIWWGFSSCTSSIEILNKESFLGKNGTRTLFSIQSYSGKYIRRHSYYNKEEEILLLPATQFQVIGCLDQGNGLQIVQLKEIQPEFSLIRLSS